MPLDPAFVLKDIVDSPNRAASFGKGGEEGKRRRGGSGEYWKLERKDSVELGPGVGELEAEELESKLEKWRIDLSPPRDMSKKKKKHRRAFTLPACFCGASD